jgi:hypothetical protein
LGDFIEQGLDKIKGNEMAVAGGLGRENKTKIKQN